MRRRYAEGVESLIDFKNPRSWWLALGFYAAHFAVLIFLSFVIAYAVAIVMGTGNDEKLKYITGKAAEIAAIIYTSMIYILIIYKRATWKKPLYLAGFALTVGLSIYGASLYGLIPPAVTLGLKPRKRRKLREPHDKQ